MDSEVAVAAVVDELNVDDFVVEAGEGVVVGRMRIEVEIALVVDTVIVGLPDAVRIAVMLLELVVTTELLSLLEVAGHTVVLVEVERTGGSLVVEVLEAVIAVEKAVLAELASGALLELSCAVLSNVVEAALSAVDDTEMLLEGTAATTCSPVLEALAATPGVIAWLTAAVADDSRTNAVVVFETGETEGDLDGDKEEAVEIDKLVALLLVDLSVDVDMVVGIEVIVLEEVIAEETTDDRDKLDVVEKVMLFRFAVGLLMLLDADKDKDVFAGIVVYSTTVVNEVIVDFASVVPLILRDIVRNDVVVDVIVVSVVDWLFGDLGGRVKLFQAERAYKHRITIFVQQKPYQDLL